VEILYFAKAAAWSEKGQEKVTLPALDLPISRTGLLFYYPPLFKVTAEAGTFRAQEYENPTSEVLEPAQADRFSGSGMERLGPPKEFDRAEQFAKLQAPPPVTDSDEERKKKDATQALLDTFREKSMSGKVTGILPINVAFPAFGPSIFLVSELTSENQFAAAEFSFARDKKGGVR
jgi:hypothetical protein